MNTDNRTDRFGKRRVLARIPECNRCGCLCSWGTWMVLSLWSFYHAPTY